MRYDQYRLIPPATEIRLALDDPLFDYGLAICLSPAGDEAVEGVSVRLPAELDLRLRTRRPGDRFAPKGMGGHSRKIKHWMIDRKIPREIRDRIPLVCAEGEVFAICLGGAWHLADTTALPYSRVELGDALARLITVPNCRIKRQYIFAPAATPI